MNVKCRSLVALKMTSQLKVKKKRFCLKRFKTKQNKTKIKLMLETRKASREAHLAETDAKAMNFAEILMGTKRNKI